MLDAHTGHEIYNDPTVGKKVQAAKKWPKRILFYSTYFRGPGRV